MYSLENLNALREAAGKKPLKAWKESKAKLKDAIDKLRLEPVDKSTELEKAAEQFAKAVISKQSPKAAVKELEKALSSETITLVEIAKELSINPRVARAKMRRVKSLPEGTVVGKHTYARSHKHHVIDALKHDFRKK